jgi:membrane-bound inhibitor of C-type lysozyme
MNSVSAVWVLVVISMAACTPDTPPAVEAAPPPVLDAAPVTDLQRVFLWTCEDGTMLRMDNLIEREAIVLYLPDGMLTLPHVISASGAKYEDDAFVFWTKGAEALLERKPDPAITCRVTSTP